MLTNEERDAALAASPSPTRITPDYIKSRIADVNYHRRNETTTLCTITIDNGFSVHGYSACVDAANFRQDLGEKISYDNAFAQLWPLFGFLLAEKVKLGKEATGAAETAAA